ncbi:O-antigen ligase family protein, partial [Acidimicrobiia bacterium]|nr:O-antigen ligase family protein [Acidimicrobiia bacterium]
TFDDEVPFFYIFESRLYSADGNLNWRLQLWQEIIIFAEQNDEILFGQGFDSRPPVFDNFIYSGLDGLNENSHNYFLNIFIRGGIFGLFLVLYFFYNMIKIPNFEFLLFFLPLAFISMFDGSMENPYFAIVFYFFVSSFFTGVKFKKR